MDDPNVMYDNKVWFVDGAVYHAACTGQKRGGDAWVGKTASRTRGNIFWMGSFLDFVRRLGTKRGEGRHGAHVRGAERNRVDRR